MRTRRLACPQHHFVSTPAAQVLLLLGLARTKVYTVQGFDRGSLLLFSLGNPDVPDEDG